MGEKVGNYKELSSIKKNEEQQLKVTGPNLAWGGNFTVSRKSLSASTFFDIQPDVIMVIKLQER